MESSESVLEVKQLGSILKRRFIPIVVSFVSTLAISNFVLSDKEILYTARGKLLLENASSTSYLTEYGEELSSRETVGEKSNPLNTEVEIIKSESVLEEAQNLLKDQHDLTVPLGKLSEQLTVKAIEETDILSLSYQDTNPEKAATIVNTVIDVYLDKNLHLQTAEAVAAREFLETQIPKAQADLLQAEDALRQFKETNRISSIEEEYSLLSKLIREIQTQIRETQAELAYIETQSIALQNTLGMSLDQAIASTSLSQSKQVQRLQEELEMVRSELEVQRTIFKEEEPTIMALKSKEEALEKLLQKQVNQVLSEKEAALNPNLQVGQLKQEITEDLIELESQRLSLASQLSNLYQTQAEYEQRLARLPILEQKQSDLIRQVEDAKLKYELLLPKLQEVRIVENQTISNARVISYAKPPKKGASLSKVYYLASMLLALISAVGITYLLEITDKSIRTVEQAQQVFGYPVLATVPFSRKKKRNKNLVHQGSYRILQTKLEFLISEKDIKTIVIASSVSSEGKSEIAWNLSLMMALARYKVLLLTTNRYESSKSDKFQSEPIPNIDQILSGELQDFNCVKNIQLNLDVLPLGEENNDLMTGIDPDKIVFFINQLSKKYDLIVLDTPSLKKSMEAQTLGKIADGIIFIVRLGFINSSTGFFYKEILGHLNPKVLGQVINGVPSNHSG